MICNNSFYSGSRHTCRPFPFYVQRLTAHGLSTDDTRKPCRRYHVQQIRKRATVQRHDHGTHKPSEFVQTHGRWRNGSEFRTHTQADDHATDTMTGTAHMLSDCVPSMTTATPSVGMCNGECFMFYVSHTGVQRHDQRHTHKRGAMPCVLSASNGTSRMTTHKHTERLTDGKQTASHVTC